MSKRKGNYKHITLVLHTIMIHTTMITIMTHIIQALDQTTFIILVHTTIPIIMATAVTITHTTCIYKLRTTTI